MASGGKSIGAHVSEETAEEIERVAERRNESKSQVLKRYIDAGLSGRTALEEWTKDFALILVALSVFVVALGPSAGLDPRVAWVRAGALFVVGGVLALGVHSGAVARVHRAIGGWL
jgi:hypothetical protein